MKSIGAIVLGCMSILGCGVTDPQSPVGTGADRGEPDVTHPNIAPQLKASVSQGIAPLFVHFDAVDTTATQVSRAFHDLGYKWDFGDAQSGTWSHRAKQGSRNQAFGPVSAHVFETPGTYRVVLEVIDHQGNRAITSTQIEVSDPERHFAGNRTVCISRTTEFADCPVDADRQTVASNLDLNSFVSYDRVLLRRGDAWTNVPTFYINKGTPFHLGAFGACQNTDSRGICDNNPMLTVVDGQELLMLSGGVPRTNDTRITDLHLVSNNYSGLISAGGTVRQVLLHRVKTSNGYVTLTYSPGDYYNANGSPEQRVHTMNDLIGVVGCDLFNPNHNPFYVDGTRLAIMENKIRAGNLILNGHALRIPFTERSVIRANEILDATSHILKMHAPRFDEPGLGFQRTTNHFYVSDNYFSSPYHVWGVAIGPQNSLWDERVEHGIFDGNTFAAGANETHSLVLWAQNITVRHNQFIMTASAYVTAIGASRRGIEPAPEGIVVTNNSAYYGGTGVAEFIGQTLGTAAKATHNIFYAPLASVATLTLGNVEASHNLSGTDPRWVDPSNSDFHLSADSPAIGAGVRPMFSFDFDGKPMTASTDLGAFFK